jgi:hypothetical protein
MSALKGEGNQSPAAQMLADEAIDSIAFLEAIKQCREAIRLIVQRKHRLMYKRECSAAHFG